MSGNAMQALLPTLRKGWDTEQQRELAIYGDAYGDCYRVALITARGVIHNRRFIIEKRKVTIVGTLPAINVQGTREVEYHAEI